MKNIKHTYLFLLIYVIISFESPVSCDPSDESKDGKAKLIDVDIKNIYNSDLDVLTSKHRPEVRKIAPRGNKVINSIKIEEEIIWKKRANSRCVNFLLFLTDSDKLFIVLNTRSDGQKLYINLVYDPTEGVGSDISDEAVGGSKIRYVGLLPFLIELNEEFAEMRRYKNEIAGVELNVKDIFDKWYYKYTVNSFVAHHLGDKPVLNYAKYEPNEGELFVKVTDSHRTIWIANPQSASRLKFCKKVEAYSKYNNIKLLRLSLVGYTYLHFRYNFINDKWNKCEQIEFENKLKELGFDESKSNDEDAGEGGQSTSSVSDSKESLKSDASVKGVADEAQVVDVGVNTVAVEEQGEEKMDTAASYEDVKEKMEPGKNRHRAVGRNVKAVRNKRDRGTNAEDLTKVDLNIWEINSNDFYFVKNKVSLMRILTMVPKVRRRVEKLYFNEHEFRYIMSEDFKIDFIKWKNSFHFTETMLKNNKNCSYYCHYLDKERSGKEWNADTQDDFYRKMVHEFEYFDVDRSVKYKHFSVLDELSELAGQPNYKKLVKGK